MRTDKKNGLLDLMKANLELGVSKALLVPPTQPLQVILRQQQGRLI